MNAEVKFIRYGQTKTILGIPIRQEPSTTLQPGDTVHIWEGISCTSTRSFKTRIWAEVDTEGNLWRCQINARGEISKHIVNPEQLPPTLSDKIGVILN